MAEKIELKFTIEDFRRQNVPDFLLNLWSYNFFKNHSAGCQACKIYSGYCEEVLEEKWSSEWGDFKFVIEKIKNVDKSFIDLSRFSSSNRWEIFDILIKKNEENKN